MSTRTVTNLDHLDGDVYHLNAHTIDAKNINVDVLTVGEHKEHIKTTDSIIELDVENKADSRTAGIVTRYNSTHYTGLLRKPGAGWYLVDAPSLPTHETDPATLPPAELTVKRLKMDGGMLLFDATRHNVFAGTNIGSGMYTTYSNPPQNLFIIGSEILNNTWSPNDWSVIAIGYDIMNTSGVDSDLVSGSIAIGVRAMKNFKGSSSFRFPCIAIGREAMRGSIDGYGSIALGDGALRDSAHPSYTVAIGLHASRFGDGDHCVYIGDGAGHGVAGTTNSFNVGIGQSALRNVSTGGANVGVGNSALIALTTGSSNVGVGTSALLNATTGVGNVAVGSSAGWGFSSGDNNVFIGRQSGIHSPGAANNRIAIGYGVQSNVDNTAVIGNGNMTSIHFGHNTTLSAGVGNATLGTAIHPVRGMYLRSQGGTPALFDRYEEFNVTTNFSGPWSGTKAITLKFTITGRQVHVNIPPGNHLVSQSSPSIYTPAGAVPSRICPPAGETITHLISGAENAGVRTMAIVEINPNGTLRLYSGTDHLTPWNNVASASTTWGRINFSYTL